ncbi:MAG: hypothetical protein UHI85_04350, partial [Turicibacter sp.]|nr:hypothetical protein [Turicibacter sp.]
MKRCMKYMIYSLPVIMLLVGELLIQLGFSRSQVYVPLLALFPFVYLLQGNLVAIYGGKLLIAVIITSLCYFVGLLLFLNYSAWFYILIYLAITWFIVKIIECIRLS